MANFDMNEVLASKWMSISDIPQEGLDLQVLNLTKESVGEMLEEKFAMHFNAGYKPLLLNRTNARIMMSLYGPQTQGWIGKTVNIYNDPTVSYGGRITGGVRIRPPMQRQQHGSPPAPTSQPQATAREYRAASGAPLVDDIPF